MPQRHSRSCLTTWKLLENTLWVDCLMKPTLLSLIFLHAEWNGDFHLQQHCLKKMLPYFAAASHYNYFRYLNWYTRQVENLTKDVKASTKQEHKFVDTQMVGQLYQQINLVNRHTSRERRVHAGGIKGISTNLEQVPVWVNSFSVGS